MRNGFRNTSPHQEDNRESGEIPERTRHCNREQGAIAIGNFREGVPRVDLKPGDLLVLERNKAAVFSSWIMESDDLGC